MSLNILAQQRLNDIEAELERVPDSIERIYLWFMFIRTFSKETQQSFDKQYEEFIRTCEEYVLLPDPAVRAELKKQIKIQALELQHLNSIMTHVAQIQRQLEKDITT